MDGAVHAAAAQQRAVGGVDDGVHVEPRDVALDDAHAVAVHAPWSSVPERDAPAPCRGVRPTAAPRRATRVYRRRGDRVRRREGRVGVTRPGRSARAAAAAALAAALAAVALLVLGAAPPQRAGGRRVVLRPARRARAAEHPGLGRAAGAAPPRDLDRTAAAQGRLPHLRRGLGGRTPPGACWTSWNAPTSRRRSSLTAAGCATTRAARRMAKRRAPRLRPHVVARADDGAGGPAEGLRPPARVHARAWRRATGTRMARTSAAYGAYERACSGSRGAWATPPSSGASRTWTTRTPSRRSA